MLCIKSNPRMIIIIFFVSKDITSKQNYAQRSTPGKSTVFFLQIHNITRLQTAGGFGNKIKYQSTFGAWPGKQWSRSQVKRALLTQTPILPSCEPPNHQTLYLPSGDTINFFPCFWSLLHRRSAVRSLRTGNILRKGRGFGLVSGAAAILLHPAAAWMVVLGPLVAILAMGHFE